MASQDLPLLSSSSAHRLPTISASQALHSLHARGSRVVSTGLPQLNEILSPQGLPGHHVSGGYMRGKVTEVFGPSGAGKTAFGIQAAVNALREGQQVVWVDAACAPLVPRRVNDVLTAVEEQLQHNAEAEASTSSDLPLDAPYGNFHYFTASTLAHLLALLAHPPQFFPPANTSIIVIDSLSTLLDNAYPRNVDHGVTRNKNDQTRWAAGRKFAVINELISTLGRVAATHDIALLLTCQTITRIRGTSRAVLVPAISGAEWENGISNRLVLFRDWVPGQGKSRNSGADRSRRARFVGVLKANGVVLADQGGVGNVVSFAIEKTGVCDMNFATVDIASPLVLPTMARPPKRPFAEIDEETEDPESDELYGWVEDDEVAAEGLLIDERPNADDVDAAQSRAESRTEEVADSTAIR